MKFRFFNVSAFAPEQGQEALNRFCGQHRVVSVEKQFVGQGLESAWSICVTYLEGAAEQPHKEKGRGQKRATIDYREVLDAHDLKSKCASGALVGFVPEARRSGDPLRRFFYCPARLNPAWVRAQFSLTPEAGRNQQ